MLKKTVLTFAFLTIMTTFYGFNAQFSAPVTDDMLLNDDAADFGSSLLSDGEYVISAYDNVIRNISEKEGHDWRLMAFCRGGVSKTKSKIAKAEKKTGACSQFSEAYPIFCKDTIFRLFRKKDTFDERKKAVDRNPQPSFRIFRKTHPKTATTIRLR